jgi:hypothetical protein
MDGRRAAAVGVVLAVACAAGACASLLGIDDVTYSGPAPDAAPDGPTYLLFFGG